jgi:hypothetical protein
MVDSPALPDDYAAGVAALTALVARLPPGPPVTQGRMFNGDGVRVHDTFFAFIGRNGDLVAKLPGSRVFDLVSSRAGAPVVMGKRTMRQWVRIPAAAGTDVWAGVLREAFDFVGGGDPRPVGGRAG